MYFSEGTKGQLVSCKSKHCISQKLLYCTCMVHCPPAGYYHLNFNMYDSVCSFFHLAFFQGLTSFFHVSALRSGCSSASYPVNLCCFASCRWCTHPFAMTLNCKAPFLVRQIFALVNIDKSPLWDMYPHQSQPWWPSLKSNQVIWKQGKWQTNQWLLIVGTLSPLWFNYLLWWGRAARQGGRQAEPTTLWLMGPGPRKWVIQTESRGGQKTRREKSGEKKEKRN